MNETHDPAIESWVESANSPEADFPLQNLPFGVFREKGSEERGRVGVALGNRVIDMRALTRLITFEGPATPAAAACNGSALNELMNVSPDARSELRRQLFALFRRDSGRVDRELLDSTLTPLDAVELLLPATIGDYTDFYASVYHATNVGRMFRPDNPLLPNYKYVPIAYHGRASSIVVSGTPVRRPRGQQKDDASPEPRFAPSRLLDYELEVGIFLGPGNRLGSPIDIGESRNHLFGFCLLNDWSARDIQAWEYQPLGPFLAKNFATTISPWVVSPEALEPFRVPAFRRPSGDPKPLPYLFSESDSHTGGIDVTLTVSLSSETMRKRNVAPVLLSSGNFRDLYWTPAQMVVHHASNGCNLKPGDLLGSGTVSGPSKTSFGCLLELTRRGAEPLVLPTGEQRRFLEDGDEVIMRGVCRKDGFRAIGFGECGGTVLPAEPD